MSIPHVFGSSGPSLRQTKSWHSAKAQSKMRSLLCLKGPHEIHLDMLFMQGSNECDTAILHDDLCVSSLPMSRLQQIFTLLLEWLSLIGHSHLISTLKSNHCCWTCIFREKFSIIAKGFACLGHKSKTSQHAHQVLFCGGIEKASGKHL